MRAWEMRAAAVLAGAALALGGAEEPLPLPGLSEVPAVAARVDGSPIAARELICELANQAGPEALARLVRRALVEEAAEKAGVKVSAEELAAELKLEQAAFANESGLATWQIGEQAFAQQVRLRRRMDLEEYQRVVLRQRLLVRKLMALELDLGEPRLRRFFDDNPRLFQPRKRFRAAHILVTPYTEEELRRGDWALLAGRMSLAAYREHQERRERMGDRGYLARMEQEHQMRAAELRRQDPAQLLSQAEARRVAEAQDAQPEWRLARQRALECLARLQERRISWEQAVAQYTQDPADRPSRNNPKPLRQRLGRPMEPGEVDWFTEDGPLVREFYLGAKDLAPGGIGGLVRTPFGYHIVRMLEVDAPRPRDYAEVRETVAQVYADLERARRSREWMENLERNSRLETPRAPLWPPPAGAAAQDAVVLRAGGRELLRSNVWRELVRTEGRDALQRLINREVVLGPLRKQGPEYLEWVSTPARFRSRTPPPQLPIEVKLEEVDLALNLDRLRVDQHNEAARRRTPPGPPRTLEEDLYVRYGLTLAEHRRNLEAALVLEKAVRRRLRLDDSDPAQRRELEATLRMEFALVRKDYAQPMAFDASQILVALAPEADAEARENALRMAQSFRSQLVKSAKTWEELVQLSEDRATRSRGGHLGWLEANSAEHSRLYELLRQGNYEKGQVTPPLLTSAGFHVVRIEARRAERLPEFEEVREQVQRDFFRGRAALAFSVWLRSVDAWARVERFIFQEDGGDLPQDYFPLPPRK